LVTGDGVICVVGMELAPNPQRNGRQFVRDLDQFVRTWIMNQSSGRSAMPEIRATHANLVVVIVVR
jgi:hypothetical protein